MSYAINAFDTISTDTLQPRDIATLYNITGWTPEVEEVWSVV